MTSFIVSCPCPCGHRFPVDSETMRTGCRACGATGPHFCPGSPHIRNVSEWTPKKWARAGRLNTDPEDAA